MRNRDLMVLPQLFLDVLDVFADTRHNLLYDCGCEDSDGILRAGLEETEDGYLISAEVPGITKDNVSIQYKDNYLVVKAEWKEEKFGTLRGTILRDGKYSRAFYMPDIDSEKIDATLKDGVLTLSAHKREAAKTRSINIKVDA